MNAALVEFVENDGRDVSQQRILLQPRGENSLGREDHARLFGEAALETNVPAHFLPGGPALLFRHAACHCSRGHPTRLQHDDASIGRAAHVQIGINIWLVK